MAIPWRSLLLALLLGGVTNPPTPAVELGTFDLQARAGAAWPQGNLGSRWHSGWSAGVSLGKPLELFALPLSVALDVSIMSLTNKLTTGDTFLLFPVQGTVTCSLSSLGLPLPGWMVGGGGVAFDTLTLAGASTTAVDGSVMFGAGIDLNALGLPLPLFLDGRYQLLWNAGATGSLILVQVGARF